MRPDRKMRDLAAVVHAELSAIAAGDFHEAELKHVKRDLTAKMTIGVDGMPPAARLVGEALVHGRTLNEVREWRRRIEEVGINEVREAAKALSSAPSVTGLLTDKSIGAADRRSRAVRRRLLPAGAAILPRQARRRL